MFDPNNFFGLTKILVQQKSCLSPKNVWVQKYSENIFCPQKYFLVIKKKYGRKKFGFKQIFFVPNEF